MQDVILPDGSVYRFDDGSQSWRHIPDVATANAMGVDFNNLDVEDQLPGPAGPDWPSVTGPPPPEPSPPPPPPPPSPPSSPPGSTPSTSFSWGGQTWQQGDLAAFIGYLAARGVSYQTWASNHPDAAAIIEGPPADPSREPLPKSLGEALQAYIAGGASASDAAAQAEALRASLVNQGVSGVTPAQLLRDAQVVKANYDAGHGAPPPAGEPSVEPGPVVGPPPPPARDPSGRELASAGATLPVIPAGFATIVDGKVTEGFVIVAALIEHADPWIVLGTCQVESGFNLEQRMNSAGAVGPMQEVGYPPYSTAADLEQWAWGNLIAGARLLAKYAAVYDSDQQKMSAAYNAGPGAVNQHWPSVLKWLEVAGHPEDGTVQDYVNNVARAAGDYRASFGAGWNLDPQTGKLINGKGPVVQPPTLPTPSSTPTGVNTAWQKLVGTLAVNSPKTRDQLRSEADQLVEIFK